eukprot:CAMPEP_0118841284 /NCGR_PEP_ID=MMETSP1162-20130426/75720_1 /TAXON_ID=33656 /ORGANISM="Phaeocystis Sp, Strain CCMP2710" /LENGTH=156 /DNA_ID=CAMNT_0006773315 /DNA_START=6 /DNA_END=473 /DNA_ORIENTATION=+
MAGFVRMRCERPRDATANLDPTHQQAFLTLKDRHESLQWLQAQLLVAPHAMEGLIEVRWTDPAREPADAVERTVLETLRERLPERCALVRLGTRAARDAGLLSRSQVPLLSGLKSLLQLFASAHTDNVALVAAPPRSLSSLIHLALGDGAPPSARQ